MHIEVRYKNCENKIFHNIKNFREYHFEKNVFDDVEKIILANCTLTKKESGIFSLISHDGKVNSDDIGFFGGMRLEINDWGCMDEGKGLTIPALQDLNFLSGNILVNSIHTTEAVTYWLHMYKKGLVKCFMDVCASTGEPEKDIEVDYLEQLGYNW